MEMMMQEAPITMRGRMYNRDSAKPREQKIPVLKTAIAGMDYYIENEEEQKALNELAAGDELLLYREPENEKDKWAIAVYRTEEDKIGYITRFKNETIARLMDAGKKFVAEVADAESDPEIQEIMDRENKRYRSTWTEDLVLPFVIYMIEEG